ncbi:MAG: biopolymer transporter ExbD [Verrucomicrobiales bacterium]|nr:biopolymer transporter ExbD [Verrucomicrobiales bacterium]
MNIYRKRRQRPVVPIVTLIDILAILLIFFIVTTTFKKNESLVKVNLPRSSALASGEDRERRVPLALGKDGQVSLGTTVVPIDSLATALRDFKNDRPGAKLELNADEGAPLGLMVKVWDAATRAGLEINDLPLRILLDE